MLSLTGAIKHYAWGSTDAIPEFLGREPDGRPWAEYWLGDHPDGPALSDDQRLNDLISRRPASLGEPSRAAYGDRLPYLVKLLSAASPLSIQAHPNRAQAEAGYAREDEADIALDDPQRCFRDTWPKPEILIALSSFDALYGLRAAWRTAALLSQLNTPRLSPVVTLLEQTSAKPESMRDTFFRVLEGATAAMVSDLADAAARATDSAGPEAEFVDTIRQLTTHFPEDPSVVAALMLNRVTLARGQAIFVAAGVLHAYLRGDGVEVMASSDNVLRAGLTHKSVNRPVLREIGDFQVVEPALIAAEPVAPGLYHYPSPAPEFGVWLIDHPPAALTLPASATARIVFGSGGTLRLRSDEELTLEGGRAYFAEAGEPLTVEGTGQAFLVAGGR